MNLLKTIYLLSIGTILLLLSNVTQAQTFYRFQFSLSDNIVRTLVVDNGEIGTGTLASSTVSTHVEERFILKQHPDGYCYIASATDKGLFLRRNGNEVMLTQLNDSVPSEDYKWNIIYAGEGLKGCITTHDLSQLLSVNTDGSLQMINFANGSEGNIKFTITKVTNKL